MGDVEFCITDKVRLPRGDAPHQGADAGEVGQCGVKTQ